MQILSNSNRSGKVVIHSALLAGVFVMLFPFLWMILTSFKSNVEVIQLPPTILPQQWTISGYTRVWERNIITAYGNTIFASLGIVFFQLLTASMAAYAFARLKFPGRKMLFFVVLGMMMVPQNMTMIPKYRIVSSIGLADTLWGIITPNFISISVTFFMRQSFMGFPTELEDAAKIDGCSHMRIFTNILIPLSSSIIIAMGVMVLLFAWNDLLWPTIVITSEKYRVLSMFIALCKGQYITDYGFLMAASVLAIMPIVVVYAIFQKAFVSSITMSGIKG